MPSNQNKKICCHCREEKEIESFGKNKSVPGGLHRECKKCVSERMRKKRENHEYSESQKAYLRAYQQKPEIKARLRKYRLARYDTKTASAKSREWKMKNRDRVLASQRKRYYERRANDPRLRLDDSISANLRQKLRGVKCGKKWQSLVGFSVDELKRHLERQFLPGMSWDNYGEWHVDHIIPIAAFNYKTPDDIDFKKCWTLKNLQPLWRKENLSKGSKLDKPFQPSLSMAI